MAKSGGQHKSKSKPATLVRKKKSPTISDTSAPWLSSGGPYVILAISTILFLQARIKLLTIPMERDEAGFAYIGHWLLHNKSLYVDVVDNKLPGLYMVYGLFTTLFGYSATGVHLGLLLANIVTAVCFFLLLRDLFNVFIASVATAFALVLLISPTTAGFAAHATQVLLPFVMAGWLLFWKGITTGRKFHFFLAGFLLGFAFLIKQQSVVFGILAAALWWVLRLSLQKHKQKKLPILEWILLGIGGLMPVALTAIYFVVTDRFDELYFWTVTQPARLAAAFQASPWDLFKNTFPKVVGPYFLLWIVSGIGLVLVWLSGFKKSAAFFAMLFALFGFASVAIGAAYYKHYFILAMPGVALLAAVSLYWLSLKAGKSGMMIGLVVALILLLWPVIAQKEYFFKPDFSKIHQKAYSENMFPELERIGQELEKRVPKGQKIGILGSEPGVLVAAKREGCSQHLFMYPILSDPLTAERFQNEYLSELQSCAPQYLVYNTTPKSWATSYEQLGIFKSLMEWVNENYTTSAIAELRLDKPGEILWYEALKTYQPQSDFKVYVFEKKQ